MKKKILLIIMGFLLITGCTARTEKVVPAELKLQIYASFYPLSDYAAKIGGEHVEVVNMIPAGIEPHDWEPSPQLLISLMDADIFIYNGLGLEPWVSKVLDTLEAKSLLVVNASAGIEPLWGYVHEHHDDHDDCGDHHNYHDHEDCDHDHDHEDDTPDVDESKQPDPHVWLDPWLALQQAENILLALVQADPENEAYYHENFLVFKEQVEILDNAYKEGLRGRVRDEFIVTHRSFAYLASRYGLTQIGISGISPHAEPSPADMKNIVDFARSNGIRYIFREPLIAPRLAEVLAAEIGAEILMLNSLEGLTSEELSAGKDYFTVMTENLKQLKIALTE